MPEIITDNDAQYALDIVEAICTQVGPGVPGSSQERERAAMIKRELESHLGTRNVVFEEFTLAPGAFLGALPMGALLTLIAVLLNVSLGRFPGVSPWLTSVAALAFSIISPLPFVLEFVLYREVVDPLVKKTESVNVIGTLLKPGTKSVKRLLILSGHHDSALAAALCRFLVKNPSYIPDDTEIRFISFGSEEAGLRGSRRYVERHLGELQRLDARLLNFETVAHPEIAILTSDQHGTVKNSPEMVGSAVAAADRAGVPYQVRSATLGVGSDAGPFSQVGLKATTLLPFKVPQQMISFYHQKRDGTEILTIEPLFNVLKLAVEWVRNGGE